MYDNGNLTFVCSWGKEREKSWSGTHFSLFTALSKYYVLEDKNISCRASFRLALNELLNRVKRKEDFGLSKFKLIDKIFSFNKENPIFQFSEAPYNVNTKQYIYQDLSVSYVRQMMENLPYEFSVSTFQIFSENSIRQREKYQNDFYLSENCAGIFTMSKWLANNLVDVCKIPANKVHHVGGGYNLNANLIDYSKKNGTRFLFIGRDFKRKNGPLVVDAFKLLHQKHNNYELYIVGPNDLTINYEGIHVLGDISFKDEVEYMNLCDVFVMPSVFEAYGLVFPEALTFGLPCIGRNAYEMPYFIEEGKTGYLLKSNSAEELSCLMENAIINKEMKENVISKKDWYLNEYSWDSVAKRIHEIIG
jgi:glycosyltransferase involved in cell wall biosynthesis